MITLLPIGILFFAIRGKRICNGSITLLNGLKTGLHVALISYPISATFLWLYHHFINPGWLEFILAFEKEAMIHAGVGALEMSTRIDQIRAGSSDFAQLVGGFIGTMVMSRILSLFFSLILRRKRAVIALCQ